MATSDYASAEPDLPQTLAPAHAAPGSASLVSVSVRRTFCAAIDRGSADPEDHARCLTARAICGQESNRFWPPSRPAWPESGRVLPKPLGRRCRIRGVTQTPPLARGALDARPRRHTPRAGLRGRRRGDAARRQRAGRRDRRRRDDRRRVPAHERDRRRQRVADLRRRARAAARTQRRRPRRRRGRSRALPRALRARHSRARRRRGAHRSGHGVGMGGGARLQPRRDAVAARVGRAPGRRRRATRARASPSRRASAA